MSYQEPQRLYSEVIDQEGGHQLIKKPVLVMLASWYGEDSVLKVLFWDVERDVVRPDVKKWRIT